MSTPHEIPPDLAAVLDELPPSRRSPLAATWHALDAHAPPAPAGVPTTADAWDDLERRIDRPRRRAPDRPPRSRTRLAAVAALVLVAALASGVWWLHAEVVHRTPAGQQLAVTLPDGSEVTLAGATNLRLNRGFRNSWRGEAGRHVRLDGEAFFDVVTDARPFAVSTADGTVEVLGTAFNVRARAGAATDIQVSRGLVRVVPHNAAPVALSGGEAVRVAPGGQRATAIPAGEVAAWRHGGFAIHDAPLAEVLREIERRFGVEVRGAPDLPYDVTLTLYYNRAVEAEAVLYDVALATNLQYRPRRGGFDLFRQPGTP